LVDVVLDVGCDCFGRILLVRPKLHPVHAEGDLSDRPEDKDDADEEEDEADHREGHHLEDAVVLVRGTVPGEKGGLKKKDLLLGILCSF
jgi:hypothetical protein